MLDHIAGKNVKPRDEALVCLRFIVTTKRKSILLLAVGM